MGEVSQVILTTTDDINRLEALIVGNNARSMRIVLNRVKRRIVIYESRLVELYQNESILKARVYNNVAELKILTEYIAGRNTKDNPTQSFANENNETVSNPQQNIAYDKFKIMSLEEVIRKLDSEINRINSEIQKLQADKNRYQYKYEDLERRLNKAAEDKEKASKLGQAIAPTREDLYADQIAQARTAQYLLLKGISDNFINLSTPLNDSVPPAGITYSEYLKSLTGSKGYPDGDRRIVHKLQVYQQLFWSHGHTKGLTGVDSSGDIVPLSTLLNFDNPGDTKNTEVLTAAVSGNRAASQNSKISLEVKRYIDDVNSVVGDPLISDGVEIRPDVTIPVSESMRAKTASYPTSALRIGDYYLGSFELPTLSDSIRKNWKKRNARLYFNLPVCPQAKPSGTSTDTKEEAALVTELALKSEASDLYLKNIEEKTSFILEAEQKQLGDLPADAPEWVKIYVIRYGTASIGKINFEGNEVTVLRGTNESSAQRATDNALKMKKFPSKPAMEVKDAYSYESVIGWTIESLGITISQKEFEVILAGGTSESLGRQTTEDINNLILSGQFASDSIKYKEYLAYILYGLV